MTDKYTTYWVSEASPTLGCSIEISHDIYKEKAFKINAKIEDVELNED